MGINLWTNHDLIWATISTTIIQRNKLILVIFNNCTINNRTIQKDRNLYNVV